MLLRTRQQCYAWWSRCLCVWQDAVTGAILRAATVGSRVIAYGFAPFFAAWHPLVWRGLPVGRASASIEKSSLSGVERVLEDRYPFVLCARRVTPIFSLVSGVCLVILAAASIHTTIAMRETLVARRCLVLLAMSGAGLALGLGLCHAVIAHYVWRYTFTAKAIYARYTLARRIWPVCELRGVALLCQEHVHRGVTRTRWRIELTFAHGEKLIVSPSQWGTWLDHHDEQDALLLRQLDARLRTLYRTSRCTPAPPHVVRRA